MMMKRSKGRRKSRWSDVKRTPMLVAELLELLQAMPDTAHAVIHISVADVDGALYFFFSSSRRHTRWNCDWSSDVCSSDLPRESGFDSCRKSNGTQTPRKRRR